MWGVGKSYLYGNDVTVYTDHSAVKAVLETQSPTGKHTRWWIQVYGSRVQSVHVVHRSGKTNTNADALSRNPVGLATTQEEAAQVLNVGTADAEEPSLTTLLQADADAADATVEPSLVSEQAQDPQVSQMVHFLRDATLPEDPLLAKKIALQAAQFALVDDVPLLRAFEAPEF